MPPAIIGGVIAGAGAIGAAAIGSKAASNAAKSNQQASDTASAETRAAREQAYSTLNPFTQSGTQATGAINALLGIGGQTQPVAQQQFSQPNALTGYGGQTGYGGAAQTGPNYAGYVNANPDLLAEFQRVGDQFGNDPAAYGQFHWQTYGQNEGRTVPTYGTEAGAVASANPAGTNALAPSLTPAQTQMQAFDNFRNSTGYQFRLGEGMNALNSGYAGRGAIKSGAAIKAATEYGQNFASNEFGNYLNALGNQQAVGLQAGSAAAGVGVNAANSLGSIAMQNGANQANAGLVRASTIGQGISGVANAFGTILGPQQSTYNRLMPSAMSTISSNPGIF